MKNILVTGGAGFVGSNFIRYTLDSYPKIRIVNLDALTYAGSLENLNDISNHKKYKFIKGDILDEALVSNLILEEKIDTVVHFAAESHVDKSIHGPAAFIKTNIEGTFSLLEAVRKVSTAKNPIHFHHVSTDEVFGTLSPTDPPFEETTPYDPRSPYAASKASSDHLVRSYFHTYNIPITITNCSNNYGPYQYPEKLLPVIILNALNGRPLPIYGDGKQIRDWLYVDDHCRAIHLAIAEGIPGETYVVGGNNQPFNIELVQIICNILDELLPSSEFIPHEELITFVTDRPGHDRRYAINHNKITQELGWKPNVSLEEGLIKTVDWYLNNQTWVQKIQEESNHQAWITKNYGDR